jgi:hypothetical protein
MCKAKSPWAGGGGRREGRGERREVGPRGEMGGLVLVMDL